MHVKTPSCSYSAISAADLAKNVTCLELLSGFVVADFSLWWVSPSVKLRMRTFTSLGAMFALGSIL